MGKNSKTQDCVSIPTDTWKEKLTRMGLASLVMEEMFGERALRRSGFYTYHPKGENVSLTAIAEDFRKLGFGESVRAVDGETLSLNLPGGSYTLFPFLHGVAISAPESKSFFLPFREHDIAPAILKADAKRPSLEKEACEILMGLEREKKVKQILKISSEALVTEALLKGGFPIFKLTQRDGGVKVEVALPKKKSVRFFIPYTEMFDKVSLIAPSLEAISKAEDDFGGKLFIADFTIKR